MSTRESAGSGRLDPKPAVICGADEEALITDAPVHLLATSSENSWSGHGQILILTLNIIIMRDKNQIAFPETQSFFRAIPH